MTVPIDKVERFSFRERLIHWIVALSFLYAALTGLSLWSPRLYWLAAGYGGGVTLRACRALGGLIISRWLRGMFGAWRRHMRLEAGDCWWLRLAAWYAGRGCVVSG